MAKISIIMGSQSDYAVMQDCEAILKEFKVDHEVRIVSAHRTPDRLYEYSKSAEDNGIEVIISAAGGGAHLPGMVASMIAVPVLGVPIKSSTLNGIDSLLSIVQMPFGIPVGTLAIGTAGAKNAALLAISILSNNDKSLRNKLHKWRQKQTDSIKPSPSKQ